MSSSNLNKIAAHNHHHPEWTQHRLCLFQRQDANSKMANFSGLCNLLLLLRVFCIPICFVAAANTQWLLSGSSNEQHVFSMHLLDVSSLSVSTCTRPPHVRPQFSAPTCRVVTSAVCLLFGKTMNVFTYCVM